MHARLVRFLHILVFRSWSTITHSGQQLRTRQDSHPAPLTMADGGARTVGVGRAAGRPSGMVIARAETGRRMADVGHGRAGKGRSGQGRGSSKVGPNAMYTRPGSNWRPSACYADVIATRPRVLVDFDLYTSFLSQQTTHTRTHTHTHTHTHTTHTHTHTHTHAHTNACTRGD